MPSQWERFKQSNIAKIVIGYSLVVWVLIQLIEAVLPTFETPLWVAQTLTFLLILGFPIALLVGWAYEKLPAQSTDTDGVKSKPQLAHSTPKKTLVLVGLGSCAVIGLFGFYMMPFIFDSSQFDNNVSSARSRGLPLVLRYKMVIENTGVLGNGIQSHTAISPDGRYVAYSHITPSTFDIMLHDLTSFEEPKELVAIPRNLSNGFPTFSGDNQWIYYHLNDQIMRVRREGGSSQTVVPSDADPAGLAINNNTLIFRRASTRELSKVDLNTGEQIDFSAMYESKEPYDYSWPKFLPGRSKILATKGFRDSGETSVEVIDLSNGDISLIAGNGFHGKYLESGHVVFGRDSTIWAQPVDKQSFQPNGDSAPVIFDSEVYPTWRWANFDVSNNGRLVYTAESDANGGGATRELVSLDSQGQESAFENEPAFYLFPSIDPTGQQLAVSVVEPSGGFDIWVYDKVGKTFGRRSFSGDSIRSIWSADGTRLIFGCYEGSICVTNSDGTSNQTELFSGMIQPTPLVHIGDGTLLLTHGTPRKVYQASIDASASDIQPEMVLTDLQLAPSENADAAISSDEHWIAYTSNETGRYEIYVRPYPSVSSGKWQVSRQGGRYPRWNLENDEILWWDIETEKIMSSRVSINKGRNDELVISFDNPSGKFETSYVSSQGTRSWDFSPSSGESFFIKDITSDNVIADQIQFHIIEDFLTEVTALAPAYIE